ncbi:helix-turn-helix domain-containing protein [Rivibacter subsaxonicus]|nr:helix-turn-helix transcriptional regulator [Rivibacter subsaxonicus]
MPHAQASITTRQPVGLQLRDWRQRRRLSQLDLAGAAEVSPRHLSCVETGRALPSRAMLLRLAERLEVPLRERNGLLTAAGYAPMYAQRGLDDPALLAARAAVDLVLAGHEPYPALAVDRRWNLVAHNRVVPLLLAGLPPELLAPPLNVLRLSLHPAGLGPRIVNMSDWRGHLFARLARDIELSGDAELVALREELLALPAPAAQRGPVELAAPAVVVPLQLRMEGGFVLSFISTITVFGTPLDVTVSELAIESFFPADAATAAAMREFRLP